MWVCMFPPLVLTCSVLLLPVPRKPDANIYDDPADINGEDGVYDRVEEIDPGTYCCTFTGCSSCICFTMTFDLSPGDGRPAIAPRSRVSLQPEPGTVMTGRSTVTLFSMISRVACNRG